MSGCCSLEKASGIRAGSEFLVQFAVGYVSFVGSTPTGARYYCSSGGGISSGGGGISYIPGTIAGAAASSTSITTANGINAGYYYS